MDEEVRRCSGGAVFCNGKIFLIREGDGTWAMPKGVIREHNPSQDIARWRVEDEAGIHNPRIIGVAGYTSYRLYSKTRDREVMNRIQWFAMTCETDAFKINADQGFMDGGWFTPDEAERLLSREGDSAIVKKACEILESVNGS